MSRYILVRMGESYLGKSTRLKLTVQNAKPLGSWRWMLLTGQPKRQLTIPVKIVHSKDPKTIYDRGFRATDDMAKK